MLFRVKSKNPLSKVSLFSYSIQNARFKIVAFHCGAEELILEERLLEKYKMGLKPTCLYLLNQLTVNQVSETELVYTFKDEEADKLASYITYGDGNISGSNILVQALTNNLKGV